MSAVLALYAKGGPRVAGVASFSDHLSRLASRLVITILKRSGWLEIGLWNITMQTTYPPTEPVFGDLRTAAMLAELLQRVESSAQPVGAAQYRQLVRHLAHLLDGLPTDARLEALLKAFPAAAGLYENKRYELAGLCRSPLEHSLDSELQARAVIAKARAKPFPQPRDSPRG